jgi:hypothetical protein
MNINLSNITTLQFDIISSLSRDKPRRVSSIHAIVGSKSCGISLMLEISFVLEAFARPDAGQLVVREADGSYRLTDNGEIARIAWRAGFEECERHFLIEMDSYSHSKDRAA